MLNISKKTILLADNNLHYMEKTKDSLEKIVNVEIISMAENGEKALREAEQKKPDIIFIDIFLKEKGGIWLLKELNKKGINSTYIMLSDIEAGDIARQVESLGAYYMIRPVEFNMWLEKMIQVLTARQDMLFIKQEAILSQQWHLEKETEVDFKEKKEIELESNVSKLLNRMGITASIKGYHFIRKGVVMTLKNKEAILSMTKGLYPDIAKEYNTTASKVERAIRHAIETAWKRTGKEIFYEMAGYYSIEKPTNSQFIAIMSEYLRA